MAGDDIVIGSDVDGNIWGGRNVHFTNTSKPTTYVSSLYHGNDSLLREINLWNKTQNNEIRFAVCIKHLQTCGLKTAKIPPLSHCLPSSQNIMSSFDFINTCQCLRWSDPISDMAYQLCLQCIWGPADTDLSVFIAYIISCYINYHIIRYFSFT